MKIYSISLKKKPTTNKKSHNLGQPINIYSETESRKKKWMRLMGLMMI